MRCIRCRSKATHDIIRVAGEFKTVERPSDEEPLFCQQDADKEITLLNRMKEVK